MKKIAGNDIPHYLVLYGQEQTILDMYIKQILSVTQAQAVYVDTVASVIKQSGKKSLNKSVKCYIVTDDLSYLKAETVWDKIKEDFKKSKNYLILRYHTLDKRDKFSHNNKENLTEFAHLSVEVLQQYIYRDLPDLSKKNALSLIEYCNYNYGRILMEIDKIKQWQEHYTDNEWTPKTDSVFKLLNNQGLFHKEIGDITFELTNAVLGGYTDQAIVKLDEAKRKNEPAMMIASILYNGFRNLLAYQGLGKDKQGAMERTGLTKGELYGCTKNVGGYSLSEVKRNMLFCQQVESGIKTGLIDEDIALDYLVLHCLR
jgi:DNA polymerase III delta subunit